MPRLTAASTLPLSPTPSNKMATLIDMPKLSDTMTVGTLVKWLKNEGDRVEFKETAGQKGPQAENVRIVQ